MFDAEGRADLSVPNRDETRARRIFGEDYPAPDGFGQGVEYDQACIELSEEVAARRQKRDKAIRYRRRGVSRVAVILSASVAHRRSIVDVQ
jgi:hypothetical protein